ncbi:hypothetical protein CIHG_02889 [Coccidioides immitis H538.4]|uniref:Uncharacterized protein n=3 Tax=Coccidioides immitis TaxID=5501 RepID=A0A0J8R1J8_COCIT|nr:hypothetical protein CIRG_07601 [Coccidioides immitis RMSCC 2394]KMU79044.1 hypothetical protein CISG_07351 [Coccidioides immitis RMSCC 3703]KMU85107.1 hypothetical protein CIHG_02889 [Coccidioides immitis H538.4]
MAACSLYAGSMSGFQVAPLTGNRQAPDPSDAAMLRSEKAVTSTSCQPRAKPERGRGQPPCFPTFKFAACTTLRGMLDFDASPYPLLQTTRSYESVKRAVNGRGPITACMIAGFISYMYDEGPARARIWKILTTSDCWRLVSP